ncbi:MAG: trehalose-phosphatase, partial [Pseudomonadota bacterium]
MDQASTPLVDIRSNALFLDFDGTLAPFAPTPDAVAASPGVIAALSALSISMGNAVAIVTGRTIAEIDTFLSPLKPVTAGVHGLTIRRADGHVTNAPIDAGELDRITVAFQRLVDATPGSIVERKSHSVAIHWRQAPEHEGVLKAKAAAIVDETATFSIQHGKCVAEARMPGLNKGDAIRELCANAPFAGRSPVFIGDDVTDEDGFAAVNALGG